MSEELHKLQRIGAQKIYEKTHIPIQHIQEILQSDFSSFSRVQFLGFISILEREYEQDLSEHKAYGIKYFDEIDTIETSSLTISPQTKRSKKPFYAAVAVLLFFLALYMKFFVFSSEVQEKKVDNTLIEDVKKSIEPKKISIEDSNKTQELNSSVETPSKIEESKVKVIDSFKIVARSKVWIGYIDVLNNKKKNKTFTGEITLDPNKKWLLHFGHGYIDMYVDGQRVKFSSRNSVRFIYEDGEIRAISKKEFKKLNKGRAW